MSERRWRPVPELPKSFAGIMNAEFVDLDGRFENFLPDLRSSSTLLLGSDYTGKSSDSPYLVFSFLITTLDSWSDWEPKRIDIRNTHLTDLRRMSFKGLNDGQRQRALGPFLEASNSLNGLSFSVAINKKCDSLFAARPPLDLNNPEFSPYRKWNARALEKAFFVIHVFALLLAGLGTRGQNVLWFTDEDSIAANDDRVKELTQLFAWISTMYLDFDLGHLRCGTSRCDNETRQLEDFLAIPDLIAGALAEQMKTSIKAPNGSNIFWMYRNDFSEKTRNITWWFSDAKQTLKRLFCIVEPLSNGDHRLGWVHFYDR